MVVVTWAVIHVTPIELASLAFVLFLPIFWVSFLFEFWAVVYVLIVFLIWSASWIQIKLSITIIIIPLNLDADIIEFLVTVSFAISNRVSGLKALFFIQEFNSLVFLMSMLLVRLTDVLFFLVMRRIKVLISLAMVLVVVRAFPSPFVPILKNWLWALSVFFVSDIFFHHLIIVPWPTGHVNLWVVHVLIVLRIVSSYILLSAQTLIEHLKLLLQLIL